MNRIEVITAEQRRRRYMADEKAALVAECVTPGMPAKIAAKVVIPR